MTLDESLKGSKIKLGLLKKKLNKIARIKRCVSKLVSIKLNIYILVNKFFKTTISQRLSNMFAFVIKRAAKKPKIFFRTPFIYEVRIPTIKKKKRRVYDHLASIRLAQLFYVIYSFKQLRKISLKAKNQRGVFEHNYLLIIESKLPSYLYRTSFFPTLFESLEFVKGGNV